METAQAKTQKGVRCLENGESVSVTGSVGCETGALSHGRIGQNHMCHGQENGLYLIDCRKPMQRLKHGVPRSNLLQ